MCGIFFSCCKNDFANPSGSLRSRLEKRGPDHCDTTRLKTGESAKQPPYYLEFFSTVLSLRGDHIVKQPLVDPASSSVLCWNGEVWKIDGKAIVGNDAEIVFDLLLKTTIPNEIDPSIRDVVNESVSDRVIDMFSRITGPYAFVFYDARNAQVFYGRDVLGRRSLLRNKNGKDSFAISSICSPDATHEWVEVEADSIYRLDLCMDVDVLQPTARTQEPNENFSPPPSQPPAKGISFASHSVIPQVIPRLISQTIKTLTYNSYLDSHLSIKQRLLLNCRF